MNALASVVGSGRSAPAPPSVRSGPGGFGEAWNSAHASQTPEAPRPDARSAARAAPDGAKADGDAPVRQDGQADRPAPKRAKTGTPSTASPREDAPAGPSGDDALAALQGMIAAMTGGTTDTVRPTPSGGGSATPDGAADPLGRAATVAVSGPDLAPMPFDAAALAFTLDAAVAAPVDGASPAEPSVVPEDMAVAHQLDLAGDGAWLDQLTRDIARTADADGQLRFSLKPEHLGQLDVALAVGADGTAIRLTAETREVHRIVTDAQPQLVAEARAQGLRISETHVDLNGNGAGDAPHQSFGNQNGGGRPQPRRPTGGAGAAVAAPDPVPPTGAADALYA